MEFVGGGGGAPGCLELELTESVLMKDTEASQSILGALRARGVTLAVDDFDTGYSSLSYLQEFSIDALKIDQSFIRKMSVVAGENNPVSAVISLGRSLGLRVVAEGVETAEELAFLQAHQCDQAQGYYSAGIAARPIRHAADNRHVGRGPNAPSGQTGATRDTGRAQGLACWHVRQLRRSRPSRR